MRQENRRIRCKRYRVLGVTVWHFIDPGMHGPDIGWCAAIPVRLVSVS